jgi:hypothetical protein
MRHQTVVAVRFWAWLLGWLLVLPWLLLYVVGWSIAQIVLLIAERHENS